MAKKKKATKSVKPDSSTLFGKLADIVSFKISAGDSEQEMLAKLVSKLDDDEIVTDEVWAGFEEPVQEWINKATADYNAGKPISAPEGMRDALVDAGAVTIKGEASSTPADPSLHEPARPEPSGDEPAKSKKKTAKKAPAKKEPKKGSRLKGGKCGVGTSAYRSTQVLLEMGLSVKDEQVIAKLASEGMKYSMSNMTGIRGTLCRVAHVLLNDPRGPKAAAEAVVSEAGGQV